MPQPEEPRRFPSDPHRITVPGGWIYSGGSLSHPILVLDPDIWAGQANAGTILAAIAELSQKVHTMSGTISDQLTALTAKFQADVDGITSSIADLHTQITTLTGQLVPGATITQAQIDALSAIEAQAATLATPVVVAPPPPTA